MKSIKLVTLIVFAVFLLVLVSIHAVADGYSSSFVVMLTGNHLPNAPLNPECENQTNPGDISITTPYFDWTFSDPEISDTQGGFHIQVGDDSNWGNGAEMWNLNQTTNADNYIIYGGLALSGDVWYYWRVKTKDNYDMWGTWTATQQFKTATPDIIIRDLTILDDELTELEVSIVVENAGGVTADIIISWTLKRVDTGGILDFGTNTFEVTAHTETTHIVSPTTSYVGLVNITFTGDGVTASECFSTVGPTAPGGGGAVPPTAPPEAIDTDGDGLTDMQEEIFGSSPLLPDTDFDGYTDYEEYIAGTDPLDASDFPSEKLSFFGVIWYWWILVVVLLVSGVAIIFFLTRRRKSRALFPLIPA